MSELNKIVDGMFQTAATYNKVNGEKLETSQKIEFSFPWKENLADLTTMLGAEQIYELVTAEARTRAQAIARANMERGATEEQVVDNMATWRPGQKITVDDFAGQFGNLSAEKQSEILAKLRLLAKAE